MGDGHCGLPASELTTLAVKLLAVPEEFVASALEQELAEQNVTADSVAGTPCVFLSGLYHSEQSVAGHLRRVAGGPVPWAAIDAATATVCTSTSTLPEPAAGCSRSSSAAGPAPSNSAATASSRSPKPERWSSPTASSPGKAATRWPPSAARRARI